MQHSFNEIIDYIHGQHWDVEKRKELKLDMQGNLEIEM